MRDVVRRAEKDRRRTLQERFGGRVLQTRHTKQSKLEVPYKKEPLRAAVENIVSYNFESHQIGVNTRLLKEGPIALTCAQAQYTFCQHANKGYTHCEHILTTQNALKDSR